MTGDNAHKCVFEIACLGDRVLPCVYKDDGCARTKACPGCLLCHIAAGVTPIRPRRGGLRDAGIRSGRYVARHDEIPTGRTIRDLLDGATRAEIVNLCGGNVVRVLRTLDEYVAIDAGGDSVTVPLDTVLIYEPWLMDRGSVLFDSPRGRLKLCTELDILRVDGRPDVQVRVPGGI